MLIVLRNPDMQGSVSASWVLQQHFCSEWKKKIALKKKRQRKKSKDLVLCSTVAASKLTMQLKLILHWWNHSRFLSSCLQSCFAERCMWELRAVHQRQAVLTANRLCGKRHQAGQWWSYKMVTFWSKWISLSHCMPLQHVAVTVNPAGANVPSLQHHHCRAWIPPTSISHGKSLFVLIRQN